MIVDLNLPSTACDNSRDFDMGSIGLIDIGE